MSHLEVQEFNYFELSFYTGSEKPRWLASSGNYFFSYWKQFANLSFEYLYDAMQPAYLKFILKEMKLKYPFSFSICYILYSYLGFLPVNKTVFQFKLLVVLVAQMIS